MLKEKMREKYRSEIEEGLAVLYLIAGICAGQVHSVVMRTLLQLWCFGNALFNTILALAVAAVHVSEAAKQEKEAGNVPC